MGTDQQYDEVFQRGDIGFGLRKLSWVHCLAAALAFITGTIHVYLYINRGSRRSWWLESCFMPRFSRSC